MPERVRADIPLLAGGGGRHYLDNAATALMPRAVLAAMNEYDARARGNVGRGLHAFAEAADEAYDGARETVAAYLGAEARQVVFTAGCTAALDLAARGLGESLNAGDNILLSVAEHHSNIVPWQIVARRRGCNIYYAGIDARGGIDVDDAVGKIREHRPRLVALTHASNVSGVINDLSAVAEAARAAGAPLAIDGAQAAAHAPMNLPPCDLYAFSAHKCYGPNGIGALWGTPETLARLTAVTGGGGSIKHVRRDGFEPAPPPRGLEAGTPPITQAVGMAAALRWRRGWPDGAEARAVSLARRARRELARLPAVRCLFADGKSAIVSFTAGGVHAHDICEWLAARGAAVRGGHHCAQLLMETLNINGCVRASFAAYNNDDDVSALVDGVKSAIEALR